ncbi:hypothetical protein [Lactobacillus amylolyticus]|uniref:hypothetical protein n=1 Tax=Lactobacillus amylolyticus TaxID=83683 RepID=UPI002490550E|nr:hypothetical protein [Lactobacillus amylolyticus]
MAKTLIYADGSPTSVKISDTDTNLYLQLAKDGTAVDLSTAKSIDVKIADNNKNYLKDISINPADLPNGSKGVLILPLNSTNIAGLPAGSYAFEVWIETADSNQEIYPDVDMKMFTVFNNVVGGTTVIAQLTLQQFADKITDMEADLQNKVNSGYFKGDKGDKGDTGATGTVDNTGLTNAPAFQALQTQVNNSAVGTNLLVTSTVVAGYTAHDTGEVISSQEDLTTDYIPMASGSFTFSGYDTPFANTHNYSYYALYDSSKTYLGYYAILKNGVNIIKDSKCAYIRVSMNFGDEGGTSGDMKTWLANNRYKLEKGSVATDWCPNPTEILTQADYTKIKAAIVALGGSLS